MTTFFGLEHFAGRPGDRSSSLTGDDHTIPRDAAHGTARLSLTLWDAFTQRTLAGLDPDLASQEQSVPLRTVEGVGHRTQKAARLGRTRRM